MMSVFLYNTFSEEVKKSEVKEVKKSEVKEVKKLMK